MGYFDLFILIKETEGAEYKTLYCSHISKDKVKKLVDKYHKKAFDRGIYIFNYTLYGKGRDGKTRQLVNNTCFPSNVAL